MSAAYKAVVGGQLKLKRKGGPTASSAATAAPSTKPRTSSTAPSPPRPPSSSASVPSSSSVTAPASSSAVNASKRLKTETATSPGSSSASVSTAAGPSEGDGRTKAERDFEAAQAKRVRIHSYPAAIHPSCRAVALTVSSLPLCSRCAVVCAGGGVDSPQGAEDAPAVHRRVQRQAGRTERAPRHTPRRPGVSRGQRHTPYVSSHCTPPIHTPRRIAATHHWRLTSQSSPRRPSCYPSAD